jgi:DNA-binding transcriptional LysR family regulator
MVYRVVVTNFDTALRVVRAGLAIALVPREVVGTTDRQQGIRILPLDEPWTRRRFVLCHRGEEVLAPAARLLLDSLTHPEPAP